MGDPDLTPLRTWLRFLLLAAPLLLAFAPPGTLPPGLAYAVGGGRWLAVVGLVASGLALALAPRTAGLGTRLAARLEPRLARLGDRRLTLACGAIAFVLMLVLLPAYRWFGSGLSGDEPKYLTIAESLYRDLDADVSSNATGPLTAAELARNVRAFARSAAAAVASVAAREGVPDDRRWNLGNWTLAGRDGGSYFVQSPGLPALLAPGLAVQGLLAPDWPGPAVPLVILALLWALATAQTVGLAVEVSGSRLAGLAAGAAAAFSAPVFVGGYHFYPEAAAVAATPWLARHVRTGAGRPSLARAAVLALTAGALPWLHAKFLLLGIALAGLLALKVGRTRALPVVLAAAAVPMAALLVFDHHVTGLLRFDALYRRYGDPIYAGPSAFLSPDMASGLGDALFGARDGLLVMAPILVAGVLAIPVLYEKDRRTAVDLGTVFASLWIAAAVHGGGAAGPPGRLMAPVGVLLAVPLAVGLVQLRLREVRWTAAALLLVTAAITVTMLGDWRRTVNPYRRMFAPGEEFFRDLPDGPLERGDVSAAARRRRDVLGGAVLSMVLVFWAGVVTRRTAAAAPDPWPALRNVHLAWWGTIVLLAWVLHRLRP